MKKQNTRAAVGLNRQRIETSLWARVDSGIVFGFHNKLGGISWQAEWQSNCQGRPIQSQPVTDVCRWRRRNWNVNLLSAIHKITVLELPVLPSCRNWVQMDMLENKQQRLRDWRIWNHETPCSVRRSSAPKTDPGLPPNLKIVKYADVDPPTEMGQLT
jgi:hypothetical protein